VTKFREIKWLIKGGIYMEAFEKIIWRRIIGAKGERN
jgi:hypothetical protein